MKSWYKSKKFWMAIVAAIVGFAGEYGLNLDPVMIWAIIAPFLVYILGQGVADSGLANGIYMPREKKIGLALPQPVVATAVVPEPVKTSFDEQIPKPTTATMLFKTEWSKPYVLTNPDDPAQVEADYIGHYEAVLELAKRMFEEQKGYYPEGDIEDPCRTGDFSYPSKWLWHSQRELQIQKDFVAAIKKNPYMKYQLGGLGYLIWHTPWNDMPEWARLSLMRHVKTQ